MPAQFSSSPVANALVKDESVVGNDVDRIAAPAAPVHAIRYKPQPMNRGEVLRLVDAHVGPHVCSSLARGNRRSGVTVDAMRCDHWPPARWSLECWTCVRDDNPLVCGINVLLRHGGNGTPGCRTWG